MKVNDKIISLSGLGKIETGNPMKTMKPLYLIVRPHGFRLRCSLKPTHQSYGTWLTYCSHGDFPWHYPGCPRGFPFPGGRARVWSCCHLRRPWLVVSTPLKNTSQLGLLFPNRWKNKRMFPTTNQCFYTPSNKNKYFLLKHLNVR